MEHLFSEPPHSKKPLEETARTGPGQQMLGPKRQCFITESPVSAEMPWNGGFGAEMGLLLC